MSLPADDYSAADGSAAFTRPVTTKVAVLNELRRRMRRGEFAPGEPIRQDALARELGVSRLPVREALHVLQAEQLVTYTPNKGYVTSALDMTDVQGLYRLRELLEAEAVRQGLPQIGEVEVRRMRTLLERMESVEFDNSTDLLQLNRDFHFAVFSASRNHRLDAMLAPLWDVSDRFRALYFTRTKARQQVHLEHRNIFEACVDRDVETVIRLLDEHRDGGLQAIVKVFASRDEI